MSKNTGYYSMVSDFLLDYMGIFHLDFTSEKTIYNKIRKEVHYFAESYFSNNEELAIMKFGELLKYKYFKNIINKFKENDKRLFDLLKQAKDDETRVNLKGIILELLRSQLETIFLFLPKDSGPQIIKLEKGIDGQIADVVQSKVQSINEMMRLYSMYQDDPKILKSLDSSPLPSIALIPYKKNPELDRLSDTFGEITKDVIPEIKYIGPEEDENIDEILKQYLKRKWNIMGNRKELDNIIMKFRDGPELEELKKIKEEFPNASPTELGIKLDQAISKKENIDQITKLVEPMKGGGNEHDINRMKYLKYKTKYLSLKEEILNL